jgi:hypothetical protein
MSGAGFHVHGPHDHGLEHAGKLDAQSVDWDKQSDDSMHQHHRWAQATTALQVGIALAAIALQTRKKWLEYAMFATAGIGAVIGGAAAMHLQQLKAHQGTP